MSPTANTTKMTLAEILFFVLAAVGISGALVTIFAKNPVYSIIGLIICFFSISGHYVLMNAQFLAIVNVIVYAGAIMVLFLFVVMMMNLNELSLPSQSAAWKIAAAVSTGALMLLLIASLKSADVLIRTGNDTGIGLIHTLGKVLMNEYLFPFIMTSILLNSAMIGAVLLAKREKNVQINA
jgi:NADH-quinone oxidoreductase subunit J